MSDRISDERIAELLDGRVPAEERAELLSRLAADADDFDVFAEAGGVLREAEEDAALSSPALAAVAAPAAQAPAETAGRLDPPSVRRPSRWGGRRARWLALVPVLALALLTPVLWSRRGGDGLGAPATALAQAELPRGWVDEPRPWPVTRGGGGPVERPGLAARIGAFHTDLELAVASRDTLTTRYLADAIYERLEDEPGIYSVLEAYRNIGRRAGAPAAELQPMLDEAGKQVTEYLDADMVRLGAWTEAARIAVARRDTAFFASSEARGVFSRAERDTELSAEAHAAAKGIREAQPGAWDDLKRHVDALLYAIAS